MRRDLLLLCWVLKRLGVKTIINILENEIPVNSKPYLLNQLENFFYHLITQNSLYLYITESKIFLFSEIHDIIYKEKKTVVGNIP